MPELKLETRAQEILAKLGYQSPAEITHVMPYLIEKIANADKRITRILKGARVEVDIATDIYDKKTGYDFLLARTIPGNDLLLGLKSQVSISRLNHGA
ncbi:MAG: hypothetical protein ACE5FF_05545 [Saprospiraceae bacterium]